MRAEVDKPCIFSSKTANSHFLVDFGHYRVADLQTLLLYAVSMVLQ